ncbi:glia maturation factor beta [Trichinella spiralis]|uniref:glia maturation factor beta n=1 Tax=Trichinella spiralis TaxID=6334 RepID=UPI0001EFE575|nr:glia maturation factor beta [Trichinella spiralis]
MNLSDLLKDFSVRYEIVESRTTLPLFTEFFLTVKAEGELISLGGSEISATRTKTYVYSLSPNCSIENINEALLEDEPRFVLLCRRTQHSDGRVSFPFVLIFVSPSGKDEVELISFVCGSIM